MGRGKAAIAGAAALAPLGPWGAAAGGVAGFLFGGDDPEMPDIQFSDESMRKLEEDYPELASQIQSNKLAYGDLSRAVAKQQQGPSQREQAQQQEFMDKQASAQSMSGSAGNPMANAMLADAQARSSGDMYERADRRALDALQMQQQAGGALAGQYGNLGQLQNAAMGQNIQNSLGRDYARQGRDIGMYEGQRQDNANFDSNLIGLGGSIYGMSKNKGIADRWSNFEFPSWGSGSLSERDMEANAGQGPSANFQGPDQGEWFDTGRTDPIRYQPREPNYSLSMPQSGRPRLGYGGR